jgi:HlyD family secretion protein
MEKDLQSLKIDKSLKAVARESSSWASGWVVGGLMLLMLLGVARMLVVWTSDEPEVQTLRVAGAKADGGTPSHVILNATGYIVAHHKIQVASKVVGKVAWIGVERGDLVKANQVIARLEDDEYRAQLRQAQGNVAAVEARLLELTNGSRPEEVKMAEANLESAQAELTNAKISLTRMQRLVDEKLSSLQQLDDAKARFDIQAAHVASLERTYELVRLGPRKEAIMQVEGQLTQAKGQVDLYQTQLNDTVIRAPITGTILDRIVEQGEFVTTGFVGDRGAKGYVVSMADLRDLQVELDISQADFAQLHSRQKCIVTTDAYPDRKYECIIDEIAPEANRQKATLKVKVKVNNPDEFLRPEMNASVQFVSDDKPVAYASTSESARAAIYIPLNAVRDGAVFIVLDNKVIRRAVRIAGITAEGLRIEDGLIGGEDIVTAPTSQIKEGIRVRTRP